MVLISEKIKQTTLWFLLRGTHFRWIPCPLMFYSAVTQHNKSHSNVIMSNNCYSTAEPVTSHPYCLSRTQSVFHVYTDRKRAPWLTGKKQLVLFFHSGPYSWSWVQLFYLYTSLVQAHPVRIPCSLMTAFSDFYFWTSVLKLHHISNGAKNHTQLLVRVMGIIQGIHDG